jgi:thiol-disulfide isomerase/thioredoxin
MKKAFNLLLILFLSNTVFGQFKFSGHIAGTTKADTLYLNIPFVFGYYPDNDVAIPVDARGNFAIRLYMPQQKFGNIRLKGKVACLLLTPGQALVMNYNPADSSTVFTGTAAAENRLLDQLNLNRIPFFAKEYKNNAYAKLSLTDLQEKMVTSWKAMRDHHIALIQSAHLSPAVKQLIIQEVKANYILRLNDFARGMMDRTDGKSINTLILQTYDQVPLAPEILPAGPLYWSFADKYIGYQETQLFTALGPEKAKDPATFLPRYNITIDSGNRVAKLKGKSFVNWILVHNTYPKNIAEGWLAQNIFSKCSSGDLAYAKQLMEELTINYPNSKYTPYLSGRIKALEGQLAKNMANKNIIIADGYEKMTSIYQAINKFKGKVVYLDMWGTWCGPCKDELRYNPALKEQFKGKDVAFVYLDMDDDAKDAQWREFIKVNGMTGLHIRKNSQDMETFWNELLPKGDGIRSYPTYFIFDKNGKLVKAKAKRPSDQTELYQQIQQYL